MAIPGRSLGDFIDRYSAGGWCSGKPSSLPHPGIAPVYCPSRRDRRDRPCPVAQINTGSPRPPYVEPPPHRLSGRVQTHPLSVSLDTERYQTNLLQLPVSKAMLKASFRQSLDRPAAVVLRANSGESRIPPNLASNPAIRSLSPIRRKQSLESVGSLRRLHHQPESTSRPAG